MDSAGDLAANIESLPDKLWETIFRYLNVFQLKKVRLTCRTWQRIVDESRPLLDRFVGTIRRQMLDRSFAPRGMLPVYSISVFDCVFVNVNSWWPMMGANLSHLYLRNCNLTLPVISGMLRQTPNLDNLGFKDITLLNPVEANGREINFRLEKLTHFSLCNIPESLAKLMQRLICPRLTFFGCAWDHSLPEDDEQLIVKFFQDSLETLKVTRLTPTVDMLVGIGLLGLQGLQLRDVTFWCNMVEIPHVVSFTQRLTKIEKLSLQDLQLPEGMVLQICANLPELKHLTVQMEYIPIWQPSSLFALAPNLEYLEIKIMGFTKFATPFNYQQYRTKTVGDFRDCHAPKLQEIRLTDINPSTNLRTFLQQSPDLHTMLLDFSCDDFSNLQAAIPFSQLKSLTLRSLTVSTPPTNLLPVRNLRRLALYHIRTSKEILTQLLTSAPNLEEIVIFWIAGDDEVQLICDRFHRLKKLELHQCPVTDRCVDSILAAGWDAFETLTIHACYGLSQGGRLRLQGTAKFRLVCDC